MKTQLRKPTRSGLLNQETVSRGNQIYSQRTVYRDDRDRITAFQKSTNTAANPMENGHGDRFRYDEEGQLLEAWYGASDPANSGNGATRYDGFGYDALGNRTQNNYVASRGPISFIRRDNKLNQYSSWTPSIVYHDDNYPGLGSPGNGVTMADGWITASYNALNQPVSMTSPTSGGTIWFGYDPLGRCVKRVVGASTDNATATYLYYDGWNLIQEGPAANAVDRVYMLGNRVDDIVADYAMANGQWIYHHSDARGHSMLLTDSSGNLVEQYEYDAFGYPHCYSVTNGWTTDLPYSSFSNRFLFTGREWLSDLKLYDYRSRMYQPELGRFMQPDPKEFEAGDYNLYRYCHNDPVNRSDPTGLVDETWTRQMYLQSGEKDSFEVVVLNKSLNEKGYVSAAQLQMVDENKSKSTPGKPSRNLGGSELDEFGNKMAAKGYSTGPEGREQISYLFEKDGAAARYIASPPIAGADREMRKDENGPRKSVPLLPSFIPKGYHYVGFAYSHLQPDRVVPLIDRQRAWRYRLNAYLAVPHPRSSFPDTVTPYHYDPNVYPTY